MVAEKVFKQTEIGWIPEDWDIVSLGEFVQINSGETPSKYRFENVGIPYYKVEQLNSSNKNLNFSDYYISNVSKLISANSVIFPKRGASILLNKIRIIKRDSFFDTNLMSLTPINEKLFYEYLYYILNYKGLDKVADTTSIPQINNKHIIPFKIPLPSLQEQQAIAEALSDADAWIASLEQLIAKKRVLKQGAMQELLTPKEDWEVKKLGEVGKFQSGWGFPIKFQGENGIINFYKVSDLNNIGNEKYLKHSNNSISIEIGNKISSIRIPKGSIVFAKIGAAIFLERKRISIEDCLIDNNMGSYYSELFDTEFLYYWFIKFRFSDLVSTSALPSLSTNDLNKIEIFYPKSLKIQTHIATILSDMDSELEALEKQWEKARQIKQGMMQELLTGKIRLV